MRPAILILAFQCAALPSPAQAAGDEEEAENVVHFALIRPEADPTNDETALSPDAVWLHRPKKANRNANTGATSKKTKSTARGGVKSGAAVTPLRRERPKSEIDPPKTRRRQLGW